MKLTQTTILVGLLGMAWLSGCYLHAETRPTDGDGDTDVDADSDGDSDGDAPFVVHEWGVFSGNGVHGVNRNWAGMEADKPVLYFYPDEGAESLTVDVTVDFPDGHARETWPELTLGETIAWNDVVIDGEPCNDDYTPFPRLGEGQCENPDTWYCEATELGSYIAPAASCLTVDGEASPLLFYAGTLNSVPPAITGTYCGGSASYDPAPERPEPPEDPPENAVMLSLSNPLDEAVGPVFLIYRDIQGDCMPWGGCDISYAAVGTAWIEEVPAESEITVQLGYTVLATAADEPLPYIEPPEWLMAEEESMTTVLTDAGLTGDEAEALLNGWRHTFFDLMPDDNFITVRMGESIAAAYLVPRNYFDEALPIEIEPAPRELVRVGLGFSYLENTCGMDSAS